MRLTDDEREVTPRPPLRFGEAARTLADVAGDRPELSVGAGFDGAAVVEALDRRPPRYRRIAVQPRIRATW